MTLTADTSVTAQVSAANGYIYPLKVGPTGRYLVDQTGKPFLLVGDAPWSLIAVVSDADADLYLANRQQLGFTAILTNLLEHKVSKAPPADFYGLLPFTGKTFTPPTSGDWVLVLDSATATLPPPGSN